MAGYPRCSGRRAEITAWLSVDVQSFVQGLTLLSLMGVTYPLAFRPRLQPLLLRF